MHQALLVNTAQSCSDIVEFIELAKIVGKNVLEFPELSQAGLGVYDEERQIFQKYSVHLRSQGSEKSLLVHETESLAELSEIPYMLEHSQSYISQNLDSDQSHPLSKQFRHDGLCRYISSPLWLQGQLIGAIFAASPQPEKISDTVQLFIEKLGKIITPSFYNCINHARFARGDRRRDTLLDLSHVINSTLELDSVLTHARRVIGQLEGHRASAILLLNEGNKTYRCYSNNGTSRLEASSLPSPTVHQLTNSILSKLLDQGTIYESEDLTHNVQFEDEHNLRKRDVVRYLAVPLSARGKILGGFIFGTNDPHPRRKVEYWLYENIALQLALAIDNASKHEQLKRHTDQLANQNSYLRDEIRSDKGFGKMIGSAPAIEQLRSDIQRVATTDATVLITGETGVGKELVAHEIHELSTRANQPLIKVNCPSIPENMFESELFGHERGAFTSAFKQRIGRFELAREGTLFLDEIGELSLLVQAKLLRVLQDGAFERVGSSSTLTTNARIIAATNRDLAKAVEIGTFRADLFFRLNVFPIYVPPLRERLEDIPVLVEVFLKEFGQRMGKHVERVDQESMDYLCQRDWHGNIRELRHLIERAVILTNGATLHLERVAPRNTPVLIDAKTKPSYGLESLDTIQAEHIRRALKASSGIIEGVKGAATMLGIKPSTLRFRMKRLGISRAVGNN